tara:strand:- start:277 stop:735 length:459 start_codon:yes stop_codon:yes gene_type:complete
MLFISHRGNIYGPQPEKENTISYIEQALSDGYAVEVDVIDYDNIDTFTLGHDKKQEEVASKFFRQKNIFAHAKNYKCLSGLLKHGAHVFYHTDEEYVLTSENLIWCYPGVSFSNNDNCIIVLPELYPMKPWRSAYGICSDFVGNYRKELEVD